MFDYLFRETTTGLKRNGLVAFAAISTTFIALLLFGLALLISRQVNLMIEATTGNVEVAVYLSDPVTQTTTEAINEKLRSLDIVSRVDFESKEQACVRFKDLFRGQSALVNNVDCQALPASLRVKLSEPEKFAQVTAILGCEMQEVEGASKLVCAQPGIDNVVDNSRFLTRLFAVTRVFRIGVLLVNLGTPEATDFWSMRRYLKEFLSDRRVIEVPRGLPPSTFAQASNYLSTRFQGRTIAEVQRFVRIEMENLRRELDDVSARIVEAGIAIWSGNDDPEAKTLIVKGQANLIEDVAAVNDLERIRKLFDDIENKRELVQLLGLAETGEGVRIFIGSENRLFSLSGSSLIAAPYRNSEEKIVGVLGIIGPTRMNYARIIPMVDYTAKLVGRLIS